MAAFPTSLPVADTISANQTLAEILHASRHNTDRAEIRAVAEKVGISSSADTASHDYKLSAVGAGSKAETSANKDTDTTLAANSDVKYPSQKAIKAYVDAAITTTKSALYPVGSIYTNATNSTNPATLLGFGTWVAFGAGRVLVGIDAAQTEFDAAGETGGAKTHTLTSAEMPAHTHAQNVTATPNSGGTGIRQDYDADGSGFTSFAQGINTGSTGSGGAHNNLQPYVVVYLWQRTA